MSRFGNVVWWLLALAACVVLAAASLVFGELNQDEGWYLYAARLVSEGRLPYVDFASTQGPVLPFFYSVFQPLFAAHGVAGGRLLTAALGLCGALCAALLAGRLANAGSRRFAALLALSLVGANVYQCYFTTIVKTYALAGLLLTLSFLVLSRAWGRKGLAWAALAGVFAALAAGTRTSAGVVLGAVPAAVILTRWMSSRGSTKPVAIGPAFAYAAAGFLSLGALLLPLALKAPQAVWFALVEYHKGRRPGSLASMLAYKVGFLSRMANAYTVFWFLLLALLVGWWFLRRREQKCGGADEVPAGMPMAAIWIPAAAVTAVHFVTPFPYDDYQVMIYPVAAAALAALATRAAARISVETARALAVGSVCACLLLAVSSPMLQGWFVGKRDRIWWPLRSEFPLAKLQRAAKIVREECGGKPGDVLLTQDTYLAIEAGMRVPPGMELGPFSYFPYWDDKKAASCHVLNRKAMLELLETTDAKAAAFSGYGLTIRSPTVSPLEPGEERELADIVGRRYQSVTNLAEFGQADTTMRLMTRRSP